MEIEAPTTYSGALIFWIYILAALYFTAVVLKTINDAGGFKFQKNGLPKVPLVLLLLAISSFSTLSYHMLNVLVLFYKQWAARHAIPLPTGISSPGGLLGSNGTPLHLWQWSITSSLFQDFGEAIVATKFQYLLSSSSLLTTMRVASYMGIEGRGSKIPNLWAFFCLLEILPTSFSQTLFYMMLALQPQSSVRTKQKLGYWPLWALLPSAYTACLRYAPSYSGTQLIYIILVARLLLLLPLILPLRESTQTRQTVWLPATFYVFELAIGVQFVWGYVGGLDWGRGGEPVMEALQSHPAVKTLAYDLGHSLVAFGYWMFLLHFGYEMLGKEGSETETVEKVT